MGFANQNKYMIMTTVCQQCFTRVNINLQQVSPALL